MSEPTRMRVAGDGRAGYDVVVGHTLLDQVSAALPGGVERVALCHPESLGHLADRVEAALGGRRVLRLPLPDGEAAKSVAVAADCWERLGAAGFTRSDALVTIGGGATTDIGGFVAATWLRGVPVVHVPTTLLAMVDAAVGGKTGLNTAAGKNLVGSFHEPVGVVCDLDLLATLPAAELVAGLGEVIKCGFIADPGILDLVEAGAGTTPGPDSPVLRELVERAIAVKVEVVSADLRETGGADDHPGREVLNYGHTMGHAIERAVDYRIRHGEAVALGMVYAAELGRLEGRTPAALADRHAGVLAAVGLPTRLAEAGVPSEVRYDDLLASMRVDKKARGASLRFVVLDELARPGILGDPAEQNLRAAYDLLAGAR